MEHEVLEPMLAIDEAHTPHVRRQIVHLGQAFRALLASDAGKEVQGRPGPKHSPGSHPPSNGVGASPASGHDAHDRLHCGRSRLRKRPALLRGLQEGPGRHAGRLPTILPVLTNHDAGGIGSAPSVTGIVTDNPGLSRFEAPQKETQSYTPLALSPLSIYSKAQKALGGYKPPRDDRRIARIPKP